MVRSERLGSRRGMASRSCDERRARCTLGRREMKREGRSDRFMELSAAVGQGGRGDAGGRTAGEGT